MSDRFHIARRAAALALILTALTAPGPGAADPPGALRVGTSGDYAPFSTRLDADPPDYAGFDIAVARAYARDRGIEVQFVPFRWRQLSSALAAERFDVAMSGVTVRPERSAVGRFSVPVTESGAVALVRELDRYPDLDSMDRRRMRIGVNAGGHLERAARARFPEATLIAIPDNGSVLAALLDFSVDAVVTDTLEAPRWRAERESLGQLGPFTRDRKAYLVSADRPDLADDLDAWLLAREADGSLEALRREHLGEAATGRVATPLGALVAALDERLALMPTVGLAKRETGVPLEVPEREAAVLDAAVSSVEKAAVRAGVEPLPPASVRSFFRAQMEAAKQVQWDAVQALGAEPPSDLPDLDRALRPALLRIGARIAALLLALPEDVDAGAVRAACRDGLRADYLSESSRRTLAAAIIALAARPAPTP